MAEERATYLSQPPIGLRPKFIVQEERYKEVKEAIQRRFNANCEIPAIWVDEYNELLQTITKDKP